MAMLMAMAMMVTVFCIVMVMAMDMLMLMMKMPMRQVANGPCKYTTFARNQNILKKHAGRSDSLPT